MDRCDENTAHVTGMEGSTRVLTLYYYTHLSNPVSSLGATLAFTFYGTGIRLAGNFTLGMTASYTIDGNSATLDTAANITSQSLATLKSCRLASTHCFLRQSWEAHGVRLVLISRQWCWEMRKKAR